MKYQNINYSIAIETIKSNLNKNFKNLLYARLNNLISEYTGKKYNSHHEVIFKTDFIMKYPKEPPFYMQIDKHKHLIVIFDEFIEELIVKKQMFSIALDEILTLKFFNGECNIINVIVHTFLHEFAHLLDTIIKDDFSEYRTKKNNSDHGKNFKNILKFLYEKGYGDLLVKSLVRDLKATNISLTELQRTMTNKEILNTQRLQELYLAIKDPEKDFVWERVILSKKGYTKFEVWRIDYDDSFVRVPLSLLRLAKHLL